MLIIPAIDLQDGCVVRYVQGRLGKKVYSRDPLKTARHWVNDGAKILHVVDLDGAFRGTPGNLGLIKEIAQAVRVPIECGGGIRKIETIKELLDSGIWKVILGTRAVQDQAFLKKAFKLFKDGIIVSIDARDKDVLIKGWKSSSKKKNLVEFARALKKIGFKEAIYTDTSKDGTLAGPNIKGISSLLSDAGLALVASGGVSSLEDVRRLKKLEKKGLTGVIIGKALYEGRFTLAQALEIA